MDQGKLRYRIVGGIVLLAVLAILVPILNDVRQPLPTGPQAIDIPAEPVDELAAQMPANADVPDEQEDELQDIPEPLPAPPLTEEVTAPVIDDNDPAGAAKPTIPTPVVTPGRAPAAAPKPTAPKASGPSIAKPAAPSQVPSSVAAKPAPAPKAPLAATVPAASKPATVPRAAPISPSTSLPRVASYGTPKPTASTPTPPAVQQAWVVQLGVFGNLKTAIDLRESLRKAGYSAFTEEVATPHGKALRVRVGPELDRATAQALRDRLARETAHEGIVMAYP